MNLYTYCVRQLHRCFDYKCLLKLVKNHFTIRKSHEKLGSPLIIIIKKKSIELFLIYKKNELTQMVRCDSL